MLPAEVRIREVGPRDGFQNEPEMVETDEKVRLVDALARTGVPRLEVTSFVRADVIPQLADGPEVLRRMDIPDDVAVTVLVPNERGLEDAPAHNTRGQGLANVLAALEAGCTSFESSFGELGGCPVPAGATGNIATEDLVSMLHEMGIATGIALPRLLDAVRDLRDVLGRPLGSHTPVAGPVDWHA
jgi:isopropylmalate/homocitrate/citramalate synthase